LNKKRILRIAFELESIGFIKINKPDMLVGVFAESKERIHLNQNNLG